MGTNAHTRTAIQSGGSGAGAPGDDSDERSEGQRPETEEEVERLAEGGDEDPNAEKLVIIKDPRPGERDGAADGGAGAEEGDWARRSLAESLSAAGPARQAEDVKLGDGGGDCVGAAGRGCLWDPKGYDWLKDPCNVSWRERGRLESLRDAWYGKGDVGDGEAPVDPAGLDDWQRFAFDVVTRERPSGAGPLRMMLLGTAGTGKSRTVQSFVGERRAQARRRAAARVRGRPSDEQVEVLAKNSCLLAAPTGCASFLLKYGATTLHRAFGVPVGYCGPWSDGAKRGQRYGQLKTRLQQAELFLLDELSMIGRGMLGKIEYKVRDTLKGDEKQAVNREGAAAYLLGRDAVLAGDMKQAPPIGDDPLYRFGAYSGKGLNKPRGAADTPTNAWSASRLHTVGADVRDTFEDVAFLRQVHRYEDARPDLSPDMQQLYRRDAERFLKVTRGMAECTWSAMDHAWLARRNRSALQQTQEGRAELKRFEDAPILMDGRRDRVTGEVGANKINQLKLEKVSASTGRPVARLHAFHDKPEGMEHPDGVDAEDFRGMENEIFVCEGARVLLTQNLWVEAGLMNGAMGTVVGYMWPENADPHNSDPAQKDLTAPVCVFVKFDKLELRDRHGEPRTFFPDDEARRDWVPIFRQKVSSTVEEGLARENFPLTLAWALTHWKAQGMTLDRVRVHLSARTAAAPGIGFVACTRVRHPWDVVFEEDLPEHEAFMRVRRTRAFRERKRFELRCEARASRTLRRYGFCRADAWTEREREAARLLIEGLRAVGEERRASLRGLSLRGLRGKVDHDTWLWGDEEPDYAGLLAAAVEQEAQGDEGRLRLLRQVAERLLDRVRVRELRESEQADVAALMERVGEGSGGDVAGLSEEALRGAAHAMAQGDEARQGALDGLVTLMLRREKVAGFWDGKIEDGVPADGLPLHMSAVKEALGALIPRSLHGSLDKYAAAQKDVAASGGGGHFLTMEKWRVNVRSEDALRRGRFTGDVLEFFIRVLQRICVALELPVAVGSKTVGLHAGRAESVEEFGKIMGSWRKVWNWDEVREKRELLLPVAVDEKAQDWFCVSVKSASQGEPLGLAKRLIVCVYDGMKRQAVARRVARNLDALVRGPARAAGGGPEVVFASVVPECSVSQQRCLCAFAVLHSLVSAAGNETGLSLASKTFVPDAGQALAAVFAGFRARLGEEGASDVADLLVDAAACRSVLRSLGRVPSLVRRGDGARGDAAGSVAAGESEGQVLAAARGRGDAESAGVRLRVGTWNVAGGSWSAQAPPRYGEKDQRAAVVSEIVEWREKFGCDVVALQECEEPGAMGELLEAYDFVGSAPAKATKGHVHLYVRHGLGFERVSLGAGAGPGVAARVKVASGRSARSPEEVCVVAVHLPAGEKAAERAGVLRELLRSLDGRGVERARVLVVGDCNVRDDEVGGLCEAASMRDASYAGRTWGVTWNRFDQDVQYRGPGMRFDRAFFGRKLFAQAHLVAQGPVVFEGVQFCASDHFGLMVYVDAADVFSLRGRGPAEAARVRRAEVSRTCEAAAEREVQEVRARRQAAREEKAVEREKAGERDRAEFSKVQQRAARRRAQRRQALYDAAFGEGSLFALDAVDEQAGGGGGVIAASAVAIEGTEAWRAGEWARVAGVPRIGMCNLGNTCYVSSVLQVLLRVPAVYACVEHHSPDICPRRMLQQDCAVCLLRETLAQMRTASWRHGVRAPRLADRRGVVHDQYRNFGQWDASEFLGHWFQQARQVEIEAGRCLPWGAGWLDGSEGFLATHWDRICRGVLEHRFRCQTCMTTRVTYDSTEMLSVSPPEDSNVSLTTSELYLRACRLERTDEQNKIECSRCGCRQVHERQMRMREPPNVLLFRVVRSVARGGGGVLLRQKVDVEEEIELPGFPRMVLAGVVYHNGATVDSGHYTCMCRGPGGGRSGCTMMRESRRCTGTSGIRSQRKCI